MQAVRERDGGLGAPADGARLTSDRLARGSRGRRPDQPTHPPLGRVDNSADQFGQVPPTGFNAVMLSSGSGFTRLMMPLTKTF